MNCQGPCLLHCYKVNSLILLILGILIGIYFNNINSIKNNLLTSSNNDDKCSNYSIFGLKDSFSTSPRIIIDSKKNDCTNLLNDKRKTKCKWVPMPYNAVAIDYIPGGRCLEKY
tara:strand:- start:304 stop:645 length:342 start_codon:yes stop_codon:yes gene_type:complete